MAKEEEAMTVLLRDTIYQAIRNAILTCEVKPGQELREQELVERYRVSRSPIRDSLLRLEQENLVTVMPRQGYRVNPISIRDVEEILGLRLLIEPACAAAAARADDAALRALDRFRGFADQDFTEVGFVEYNTSLHSAIAERAGNMRVATLALDMIDQFERLGRLAARAFEHEVVRCLCAEHEAIINALQAHDPDRAFRLSYEHVEGARERVTTAWRLAAADVEADLTIATAGIAQSSVYRMPDAAAR
jgi:DNA-binding GntR family transcriptional regulator